MTYAGHLRYWFVLLPDGMVTVDVDVPLVPARLRTRPYGYHAPAYQLVTQPSLPV